MTVYDDIRLKNGMTVEFWHDENCDDPRENESCVSLYCIRLRNRKIGDVIEDGDVLYHLQEKLQNHGGYAILPLYLYEHSGVALNTSSFGDPWDSGCIGFAAARINNFGPYKRNDGSICSPLEQAYDCIRLEVKTYSEWLNGNCWGFTVRDANGFEVDSCGGFIGDDLDENGMANYLSEYLEQESDEKMFSFDCTWTMASTLKISAKTETEAKQKLVDFLSGHSELPSNSEYVDDSFVDDTENVRVSNL